MIPQAFTTRDMSEAYKWLHTLPPSVRDEMKSMEQVVMLYIKAKRLGGGVPSKEDIDSFRPLPQAPPAPEISKSSQDFQKTLKTLKTELDRFDFQPPTAAANLAPPPTPTHNESIKVAETFQEQHQMAQQHSIHPQTVHQQAIHQHQTIQQHHAIETETTVHQTQNILSALRMDPRSRQIVNEIREGLNLGSDNEVLRMALILAHKTLRDLLK